MKANLISGPLDGSIINLKSAIIPKNLNIIYEDSYYDRHAPDQYTDLRHLNYTIGDLVSTEPPIYNYKFRS